MSRKKTVFDQQLTAVARRQIPELHVYQVITTIPQIYTPYFLFCVNV